MTEPEYKSVLLRLLKGGSVVALGAMVMKFSMFALNAVFARNGFSNDITSTAKIVAFGFAWASVLHFSSVRHIARLMLNGELARAQVALKLAVSTIAVLSLFLATMIWILPEVVGSGAAIWSMLAMVGAVACFDLMTSLANAIGRNSLAAFGQMMMGVALASCAAAIHLGGEGMAGVVLATLPLVALVVSLGLVWTLRMEWRVQGTTNTKEFKHSGFREYRSLVYFSLPALLSAISMNPLTLWAVSELAGLSDQAFLVFLVCQNLLGLAMLIPGQVNTASFSLLARHRNSRRAAMTTLVLSTSMVLLSCAMIMLAIPYGGLLYGAALNDVRAAAFWFVAAALPFTLHQFVATRMFIGGHPWNEALANAVFGVIFCIGCLIARDSSVPLQAVGILMFLSYWARFLAMITIPLFVNRKVSL